MKKLTTALAGNYPANATPELYPKLTRNLIRKLSFLVVALSVCATTALAGGVTRFVTNANNTGPGSLRTEIGLAGGGDVIRFDPVFFATPHTINLTSSIDFGKSIIIDGSDAKSVTISGRNLNRIFLISGSGSQFTTTLRNLTLSDAFVAQNSGGGAIATTGNAVNLVIENCTFKGNVAGSGGGLFIFDGNVTIINSTFTGNSAPVANGGGAITLGNSGSLSITHSTIAFNATNDGGGGLRAFGTNAISLKNSIVSDNNSSGDNNEDIEGTINSFGYNIIGNTTGATITGTTTGNQLNVSPQLEGLGSYGGNSETHSISRTSPAVDAADPGSGALKDQRGVFRPVDGNGDRDPNADIGAFELQNTRYDYSGDGKATYSVIRVPTNGLRDESSSLVPNLATWFLKGQGNAFDEVPFGLPTDKYVPGDYDGDGIYDAAIYRPSEGKWYVLGSTQGIFGYRWGLANDIPVPADYDGDGKTDVAVYRDGVWYILGTTSGYTGTVTLGTAADTPVPADYDGDGKTDIAIYDGSDTWTVRTGPTTTVTHLFGVSGDIAVPADYNGDGKEGLAVFRPSNGTWYIARPTGLPGQNFDAVPFGIATDKPVPADYDGDGKFDVGVYRGGVWWVLNSSNGQTISTGFGFPNDKPVANILVH